MPDSPRGDLVFPVTEFICEGGALRLWYLSGMTFWREGLFSDTMKVYRHQNWKLQANQHRCWGAQALIVLSSDAFESHMYNFHMGP